MNFSEVVALTGFASRRVHRARRLMTLAVASLVVLLGCIIGTGYVLWTVITGAYTENYETLVAAGFTDVIMAPEVISQKVMFLVSLGPLLGACLVLPIFYLAGKEICRLYEEFTAKD